MRRTFCRGCINVFFVAQSEYDAGIHFYASDETEEYRPTETYWSSDFSKINFSRDFAVDSTGELTAVPPT